MHLFRNRGLTLPSGLKEDVGILWVEGASVERGFDLSGREGGDLTQDSFPAGIVKGKHTVKTVLLQYLSEAST
jgi:hypothetical protein